MNPQFPGFPPETLKFFRQLKRNNNREWFLAHKELYEQKVKAPMVDLVSALGAAMHGFAPEMVADPKRAIYRIYRDTRFSPDKTPYKTHAAAIFPARRMSKTGTASLYFHVAPDELIIAAGIYMPDSTAVRAVRHHIASHWDDLAGIIRKPAFRKMFGDLEGDRLVKVPRGFPPDHPAAQYLRYKQFYVATEDPPSLAETSRLFPRVVKAFAAAMPLIRFLNRPLTGEGRGIPSVFPE
jgi:uncharacterized protein (TIGR02453 family)